MDNKERIQVSMALGQWFVSQGIDTHDGIQVMAELMVSMALCDEDPEEYLERMFNVMRAMLKMNRFLTKK